MENKQQEEKIFDNVHDLFDELSSWSWNKDYVYRGISDDEYMKPKIFIEHPDASEIELKKLEFEYLSNFERYSIQYLHFRNPNEFITDAQHYGIKTRILDFTYNPYKALYFGIGRNEYDEKEFTLIRSRISENAKIDLLPRRIITSFGVSSEKSFTDCIIGDISEFNSGTKGSQFKGYYCNPNPGQDIAKLQLACECGRLIFLEPSIANQRVAQQQGLFMIPTTLSVETYCKQLSAHTKRIKISGKIKEEIKEKLNQMGITAFNLFPDINSTCDEINRMVKHDYEFAKSI